MRIAALAVLGALAASTVLAQTSTPLQVKDASGAVRGVASQQDAAGGYHYRMVQEGLAPSGLPDALVTDGAGHLAAGPAAAQAHTDAQALAAVLGSPLQVAGVATAAAQATGNASLVTLATASAAQATSAGQASQLAATQAPANIATGQGSVTTTAAQLVGARTGRRTVTVENTGTTPVYLGGSGVTASTGFLLPGVAGASLTISFSGALYAVSTGTAAVTFYETY